MKIQVPLALAGLATGFVVPAFTQEKDAVAPEARQQLEAIDLKFMQPLSQKIDNHSSFIYGKVK